MVRSLTFCQKGTPINIYANEKCLKIIGHDLLQDGREVSFPPDFSQVNQAGETAYYKTVLYDLDAGVLCVVKIAKGKTN